MAKVPNEFPGGSAAAGKSPAAEPFEPGTAPVDTEFAAETPPPFDLGLPMIPIEEGVLPSELNEESAAGDNTPGFLEDLFFGPDL